MILVCNKCHKNNENCILWVVVATNDIETMNSKRLNKQTSLKKKKEYQNYKMHPQISWEHDKKFLKVHRLKMIFKENIQISNQWNR